MASRVPNTEGRMASEAGTPSNWLHLVAACGRSLGQSEVCTEWQQMLAGPLAFSEAGLLLANSKRHELDLIARTVKHHVPCPHLP